MSIWVGLAFIGCAFIIGAFVGFFLGAYMQEQGYKDAGIERKYVHKGDDSGA